jgi:hypothetical protein
MSYHVEHDDRYLSINIFQGQANSAGGIQPPHGRDSATPEQLTLCEEWMLARVREHCAAHGCTAPAIGRNDEE